MPGVQKWIPGITCFKDIAVSLYHLLPMRLHLKLEM